MGCGSKSHTPWLMGQWGPKGGRQRFRTEGPRLQTRVPPHQWRVGDGRQGRLAWKDSGVCALRHCQDPGHNSGLGAGAAPDAVGRSTTPCAWPIPPRAPPALLPILLPPCRLGAPAPSRYKASRSCVPSTSERPSEALALALDRRRRHGRAPVQRADGLASRPPVDMAKGRLCRREPAHLAAHLHQGTATLGLGWAGQGSMVSPSLASPWVPKTSQAVHGFQEPLRCGGREAQKA